MMNDGYSHCNLHFYRLVSNTLIFALSPSEDCHAQIVSHVLQDLNVLCAR
jgi:hypothetical protein